MRRADLDLRNLHLLDYLPRESATSVMSKADCGLIVLRDDALGVMSPSKLHGYLAMSLPVIYVGPEDSNVDEAIKSFDCGISLRHGDAEGMVRFISDLAADPGPEAARWITGPRRLRKNATRIRSRSLSLTIFFRSSPLLASFLQAAAPADTAIIEISSAKALPVPEFFERDTSRR